MNQHRLNIAMPLSSHNSLPLLHRSVSRWSVILIAIELYVVLGSHFHIFFFNNQISLTLILNIYIIFLFIHVVLTLLSFTDKKKNPKHYFQNFKTAPNEWIKHLILVKFVLKLRFRKSTKLKWNRNKLVSYGLYIAFISWPFKYANL